MLCYSMWVGLPNNAGVGMGPDEIKRLRTSLSWSQERLARELGVSFSTVNRWERGKSRPSPLALLTLHKLSAARFNEGRSDRRYATAFPLEFRKAGDGNFYGSRSENISSGGLMFSTDRNIGSGESLTIGIKPDGASVLFFDVHVVWVSEGNGKRKIGVRFLPGEINGLAGILGSLSQASH